METQMLVSKNGTRLTPIITAEERLIYEIVNVAILCTLICFLGMISNCINIVIFFKQGLDNTMNISFFALAISDLCALITLQWTNICLNPLFVNSGVPWDTLQVQYLTGGWPHACFGHITCWITAYVTAERCLCIALPLKVKQIVTPRRTTLLMVIMYIVNILPFFPEYSTGYYAWKFDIERNRTILGLAFRENKEIMEGLSYLLLAFLGTVSFPAVIIFTIVLVIKLKQQAKWRQNATRDDKKTDQTSKRDMKTVKMVVLISAVWIFCYTPGIMVSLTSFIVPPFSIMAEYANMCVVAWSFVFILEAINSSVNIFLYYKMSTKYKTTFREVFSVCYKDAS